VNPVGRKLTYAIIKKSFEYEDYILLSDEYINHKIRLEYRCANNHRNSITWSHWKKGHRCSICAGVAKLNLDQVRESFEKENYVLLSKEYVGSKAKLDYICNNGHEHSMMWNSWIRGHRCPTCAYNNSKLTYKFVKESFEKESYVLLSKEYIDRHTKLYYICPENHTHSTIWVNWQQGYRCPVCAGLSKPSLKQVKESFNNEGYVLLSNEYSNSKSKLNYRCSENHEHSITWHSWQANHRCPTCKGIKQSIYRCGPNAPNWLGGISYEPYCEVWKDKEYKQDIRERDGNRCLNPYCCSKKSNNLVIHHIDYCKKNCQPNNLITICCSCNTKANTDREWHTAWYQAIIYRRYVNKIKH